MNSFIKVFQFQSWKHVIISNCVNDADEVSICVILEIICNFFTFENTILLLSLRLHSLGYYMP